MKKTTKRLFVFALSALMLASVIGLVACGKKEEDPEVTVTLSQLTARLELEETLTLTAEASDGSAVTWSTSNAQIATVSGGVVTPVAVGNAKITATAAGGASATCSVDVYEGIDTSPLTFTLYSGEDEASSVNLIVNQTATITYTAVQSGKDVDVTVKWSSSDDTVASVSDGVITAKKKGTASVTAKVTFQEKDYTKTVGVTVNNDVALELEKTAVSLHPDTAESGETLMEAQLPTSVTLGVVLYANGSEDASPTLRWESDNGEVATVNPTTGEISAVAPGTAKITAYYEGEPEQTSAYATVTVKYMKIDESDYDFTVLGANNTPAVKPDWTGFHGHGDNTAFPEGWTLSYADDVALAEGINRALEVNSKGSIKKTMITANSPRGRVFLALRTDTFREYRLTAYFADWLIEKISQFDDWHEKGSAEHTYGDVKKGVVILNGNLDFGGAENGVSTIENSIRSLHQFNFGGTFDGRGYTLSNVKVDGTQSGLIAGRLTGVVKNVAVKNVVLDSREGGDSGSQGGIVDFVSGGTIENCYVEGQIAENPAIKIDGRGLVCSRITTGTVKNCVAVLTNAIENTTGNVATYRAVIGNMLKISNPTAFENCVAVGSLYAVCSQGGDGDFNWPGDVDTANSDISAGFNNVKGYADVSAFKDAGADTAFLSDPVWDKTYGLPVIGALQPFVVSASATEFMAGTGNVIFTANQFANYSIVGTAAGVTLTGNVLTADPDVVVHGQQVTVKAVSQLDSSITDEIAVTVNNATVEDLTGAGSIADFGLLSHNATQIDLSGLNLEENENVEKVTLASGAQIAAAADIAGGKFTPSYDLWKDALTKKGETTINVLTDQRRIFIMKVNVVDRVLVDIDTWKAWRASATEYTEHVILGADIDFTGVAVEDFADVLARNNGNPFIGMFDGRGYYLLNATLNVNQRALIVARLGVGGVVKNVGVRGFVVGEGGTNTQGLVCHQFGGTVENCYVEGEIKNTLVIGLVAANYQYGTISNCVAVATSVTVNEAAPVPYGIVAAGAFDQKIYPNPEHLAVKNCIAISDGVTSAPGFGLNGAKEVNGTAYANGADISAELANFHPYLSAAAYAEDKGNVDTTGYNSYWNFEGDAPVFGA